MPLSIRQLEHAFDDLHYDRAAVLRTKAVREAAIMCPRPCKLTFDLMSYDLESGVRVTCDVIYLCVNFSLPRPPCSRLRPDVRHRSTSDRRQTRITA